MQFPGNDANGNPTISVTCISTNPSAPLVLNWFEQNAFRATSNGIGTITRNLTCYNNVNQRILNQPNESGTNSIVDQVECISGVESLTVSSKKHILLQSSQPSQPFQAPLQQFQPVQPEQQPAYNPYQAPVQYPTSWLCPSNMYCFSADTLVTIYDGHKKKRMDELLIGDFVLTADSKNGNIGFSKVTSWIHKKKNLIAKFLKFTLENGQSLKITEKHYIFKGDCKSKFYILQTFSQKFCQT
uniref:Hint domain-containing protein n=1 Tax=Panagrolaimus davidi TaxID=227884 RepID=A0A914P7N0_9BILA